MSAPGAMFEKYRRNVLVCHPSGMPSARTSPTINARFVPGRRLSGAHPTGEHAQRGKQVGHHRDETSPNLIGRRPARTVYGDAATGLSWSLEFGMRRRGRYRLDEREE